MPGVKADILAKVVEFMQHHKGVEPPIPEKPLRSKIMKELCKDPWDAEYIDKIGEERQLLYDHILVRHSRTGTWRDAMQSIPLGFEASSSKLRRGVLSLLISGHMTHVCLLLPVSLLVHAFSGGKLHGYQIPVASGVRESGVAD